TRSAAAEWGPAGVRVVGIAPGRCYTRMTAETAKQGGPGRGIERVPLRRWGQPEEPAYAMVFLASEAASYITGTTLLVDGGYVIG
ncbi:SDR family NAD(P)-dependent oxidoreductase, partial [Ciceribacter ferrooxidans]|uniref:SDR family NAD(P)-dependent oxidoreductase n=2 Tax=Pseudomonadota TaxID=1224 RepID=UPI00196A5259